MLKVWLRGRIARAVLGLLVGAATGLVAYAATRLTGQNLFLMTGAVAGLLAAFALQAYNRSARLAEVKLAIPQLSELTFVVNKDGRQVAWRLFIEMATRVSTQRLDDEHGILREAMNSLYGLFQITREALRESMPSQRPGEGPSVEELAIAMLNRELRPFLARWHPALLDWERENPDQTEAAWPQSQECRNDLRTLQEHLHQYAMGYARLAGLDDGGALLNA